MLPNRRNPFELPSVDPFIVDPAISVVFSDHAGCGCSSTAKPAAPGPIFLEATAARMSPALGVGEPVTLTLGAVALITFLGIGVGAGATAIGYELTSTSPEEAVANAANRVAEERGERRAQYEQSTLLHGQFPVPAAYRESPNGPSNSPFHRLTPIMPESSLAQQRIMSQSGVVLPAPLSTWVPGVYADFLVAVLADLKKLDWYAEEALSWIRNGPRDDHNLNPRVTETYTTWTRWVLNNLTSLAAFIAHNVKYRIGELDRVIPIIVEELSKHPHAAERRRGLDTLLAGLKAEYYTAGMVAGYIDAIHAKLPGSYEELSSWTDVESRFVTDALVVGQQIRTAIQVAENTWFAKIRNAAKGAATMLGGGLVVAAIGAAAVVFFWLKGKQ